MGGGPAGQPPGDCHWLASSVDARRVDERRATSCSRLSTLVCFVARSWHAEGARDAAIRPTLEPRGGSLLVGGGALRGARPARRAVLQSRAAARRRRRRLCTSLSRRLPRVPSSSCANHLHAVPPASPPCLPSVPTSFARPSCECVKFGARPRASANSAGAPRKARRVRLLSLLFFHPSPPSAPARDRSTSAAPSLRASPGRARSHSARRRMRFSGQRGSARGGALAPLRRG